MLFDLRPLRPLLHPIPRGERTGLDVDLIYWAESYDFLLCYAVVPPLNYDPTTTYSSKECCVRRGSNSIDNCRVCWIGGWEKWRVLFLVMIESFEKREPH